MSNFNINSEGLDLQNAFYLAQISNLAYQPLDQISGQLENGYGLSQYKSFEDKDTDTHSFLSSNDKMLVLAFRGIASTEDWLMDSKIVLVPSKIGHVHYGFNEALNSVWNNLYDTITSQKGRDQTLWVTGHSLGGALATLAVDRLTDAGVEVDGLYTYGQPRVGDAYFVKNFNGKMQEDAFRFVNNADVVTQVPFPPAYKHIDAECFFDNKGNFYTNNIFWNWFRSVSEDVAQRTQADNASTYITKNPGGIADHGLDNYIRYIGQNLSKQ